MSHWIGLASLTLVGLAATGSVMLQDPAADELARAEAARRTAQEAALVAEQEAERHSAVAQELAEATMRQDEARMQAESRRDFAVQSELQALAASPAYAEGLAVHRAAVNRYQDAPFMQEEALLLPPVPSSPSPPADVAYALSTGPDGNQFLRYATVSQNPVGKALQAFRAAESEEDREEAREELEEALSEEYETLIEAHDEHLTRLEERLAKLREQLERRREAKSEMVDLRLDALLSEADGLGWPTPPAGSNPFGGRGWLGVNGLEPGPAWGTTIYPNGSVDPNGSQLLPPLLNSPAEPAFPEPPAASPIDREQGPDFAPARPVRGRAPRNGSGRGDRGGNASAGGGSSTFSAAAEPVDEASSIDSTAAESGEGAAFGGGR